jgi:prephenate dehydrogenase
MKIDKKTKKEDKKNRKLVKDAFRGVDMNGKKTNEVRISKHLIHAIAESAKLNKALIKKDKDVIKKWQATYYQELFTEFKNLVEKHNKIYQHKADKLIMEIDNKKSELRRLKEEIRKIKAVKAEII